MISPSSISTRMTLASSVLVWRRPPAGAAGETAKLILVLEAHATAHSTAPGARLSDDLKDQVSTTSTGDRAPFSARNGAPRQGRPRTVRSPAVVATSFSRVPLRWVVRVGTARCLRPLEQGRMVRAIVRVLSCEFLGGFSQSLTRWPLDVGTRHDHRGQGPELHHSRALARELDSPPRTTPNTTATTTPAAPAGNPRSPTRALGMTSPSTTARSDHRSTGPLGPLPLTGQQSRR